MPNSLLTVVWTLIFSWETRESCEGVCLRLRSEVWRLEFVNWLILGANIPWENPLHSSSSKVLYTHPTQRYQIIPVRTLIAPQWYIHLRWGLFLILLKGTMFKLPRFHWHLFINKYVIIYHQHTLRKSIATLSSSSPLSLNGDSFKSEAIRQ